MKKRIYKKWVQKTIGVIMGTTMVLMAADCESLGLFIAKELIGLLIIISCFISLKNHTNLFEIN